LKSPSGCQGGKSQKAGQDSGEHHCESSFCAS
jgi:hypothetical protein